MELKLMIKNSEERNDSYKKLLENVYKDKVSFPADDELVIWYKSWLRDNKNSEQGWLKDLVEEKTNHNEGLNPPFCYRKNNSNL